MRKGIINRTICVGFFAVLLQIAFVAISYGSTIRVATDKNGGTYYLETDNHRIVKIDPAGKLLASYGGKGILLNPQGMAFDNSSSVFIADTGNKRVLQLKDEGSPFKFIRDLPKPIDNWLPTALQFNSSDLYISDILNKKIWIFKSNGGYSQIESLGNNPF